MQPSKLDTSYLFVKSVVGVLSEKGCMNIWSTMTIDQITCVASQQANHMLRSYWNICSP